MREYKPIRVTSVLDFVESKWKEYWWRKVGFEAADKIGKDSAEFGTRVHKLVEQALMEQITGSEQVNEARCSNVILGWLLCNSVTPLFGSYEKSLEIKVEDKKLGLIGHFDYAALVDGVPTIVDFKTSNQMRKSFPLQKAAYAYMANKMFGCKIDQGLTIRAHWNKETQQVEFETKLYTNLIKKYWPKFKMCLDIYKYFSRAEKA